MDGSPQIVRTRNGFGFLDDERAKADWGWKPNFDLQETVADFISEVQTEPKRLKKLELWG